MATKNQFLTTATSPPPEIDWDKLREIMADFKAKEEEHRRKLSGELGEMMACDVCGAHVYLAAQPGADTVIVCEHVMEELKQVGDGRPGGQLQLGDLFLKVLPTGIMKG